MVKLKPRGYYVNLSNQYADDVLSGKVVACKWIKLACERQKRDLENSKNKSFNFRFDDLAAEKICRFSSLINHVKGRTGGTLELEPWQAFIYTTVFGWVHKETGYRRFKDVYIEVAKKNGKSFFSVPVGLYMLALDGEPGAEVYVAASQREQTKHIYESARAIVNTNQIIKRELGLSTTKFSIFNESTNSFLQRLSRDSGGNNDGMNPHCALIDELHAHKTRDTHDVITSAIDSGSREQPICWRITTAGYNRASVCYEQNDYVKKILLGHHEDESYFGMIYTLDDDDDWRDPNVWIKANPNLGISVSIEGLQGGCNKAIGSSASLNGFLTKNMNIWVNSDSAWMNMIEFNKCKNEKLRIEDFKNDPCYVGCDLASKRDFACVSKVFTRKIDGKWHYYAFVDHYLNERAVEETNNDQIDGWIHDGWIKETEGNTTDLSIIRDDIGTFCQEYNVKKVSFDPTEASLLRKELLDDYNVESEEYSQNLSNMSEPTHEFEALVFDKRFHWNGDPVLEWMVANVVGKLNAKQQIYPKRDINNPNQKIDGAIATIIALGSCMKESSGPRDVEPQIFIFGKKK